MVGALKVWLYAASKAWLEAQDDKDGKAFKGAGTYRLTVLANQFRKVVNDSIRLRNTGNDSQHPQILE